MDTGRYLDLLRTDGDLLAAAARRDLDAEVPPCPGWRVRDVVEHTAEVYEHKLACIELSAKPDPWPPAWPADRDPVEWFTDAHRRLLDVLTASGPVTPAYTWWPPDQTVGFWMRRMAQETAVHRVDVQSAAGAVTPVDDELAADGVDEVLDLMFAGDWSEEALEFTGAGERIAIGTAGRSWSVTLQEREVTVADGAAQDADAAISGAPSDVLLWLWGRAPDSAVGITGDPAAVRLLRRWLATATD